MRTIILTDERFAALPRATRELLDATPATPALETGPALHEFVRASVPRKGNTPPPAFVEATATVDALEDRLGRARAGLHELIRDAHREGVPQNTLARWSGYTPRWIATILDATEAA